MKVILIKNISNLGLAGEIKNVADGYARNYLLPNHLAVPATDKNIDKAKLQKKQQQKQQEKFDSQKQKQTQKINNLVLIFKEKVDDNQTFFAGITKEKIARELKKKGFNIKAKKINLNEPIKKPGDYSVEVESAKNSKSQLKIKAQIS